MPDVRIAEASLTPERFRQARRCFQEVSRRMFLAAAAAAIARAASLPKHKTCEGTSSILALVGTYSARQNPEGTRSNGQGIHVFEMECVTGKAVKAAALLDRH